MPIDSSRLQDKRWLSLFEVMHFFAFGETRDGDSVRETGYPSDREFDAGIQTVKELSLAEAGNDPKQANFVELLESGVWAPPDAVAPSLLSLGRRLYELYEQRDEAQADESKKLQTATAQVEACLMSGKVVFEGNRDGRQERINPANIYDVQAIWGYETNLIAGKLCDASSGRGVIVWDNVRVERASLIQWLRERQTLSEMQISSKQIPMEDGLQVYAPREPIPPTPDVWREPSRRPRRDPAGYVFLARAVQRVGEALFGDEWTGEEKLGPMPSTSAEVGCPETPDEANTRFDKVQETITDAAEAGDLETAARHVRGGDLHPLPRHCWNTEDLAGRFRSCQIDPDRPFNEEPHVQPDPHWIYVTTKSLQKLVDGLDHSRQYGSRVEARKRTRQYLTQIFAESRPPGEKKESVKTYCMRSYGISDRQFRALWNCMDKHPTWSRAGPPKLTQ